MIKPFISTSTKINSFTLFYMFPHMQTSQFITVNYETTPVKKKNNNLGHLNSDEKCSLCYKGRYKANLVQAGVKGEVSCS